MARIVFTIKPNWDAGYDVIRDGTWRGSGMTRESVRQLAIRLASEAASDTGMVAVIAQEEGSGEITSVEWVDPPIVVADVELADPS